MCDKPTGYGPSGRPRNPKVTRNLPRATRPNQTGWYPGPRRFAATAWYHLARLVRTPSWAWHPERHEDGCRYARLLRAAGL